MKAPATAVRLGGSGLYGRDREVAALDDILELARSGRRAIALVDGEAGIGKTRLLTAVADTAGNRGMQVAVGGAVELEQTRPFGLVAAAWAASLGQDPRRAAIADLLAARVDGGHGFVTVTSDPGLQFRAIDAIVDLVEELALAGPMALCLDDLQWADPSSLLTLGAIIRRVTDLPVALIGSRRPRPNGPELERFMSAVAVAEPRLIQLGPLRRRRCVTSLRRSPLPSRAPGCCRSLSGRPATRCSSRSSSRRCGRRQRSGPSTGARTRSVPHCHQRCG